MCQADLSGLGALSKCLLMSDQGHRTESALPGANLQRPRPLTRFGNVRPHSYKPCDEIRLLSVASVPKDVAEVFGG